jgi:DNA-binding NarL/FixJ family response regulator
MTTILLVEHPRIVRRALCARLSLERDLSQIHEASDAPSAVRLAELTRPDVVVLDAEMPNLDLPETVRALRQRSPPTRIVILSQDPAAERWAADAGAARVVGKHEGIPPLLTAIRAAASRRPPSDRHSKRPGWERRTGVLAAEHSLAVRRRDAKGIAPADGTERQRESPARG